MKRDGEEGMRRREREEEGEGKMAVRRKKK